MNTNIKCALALMVSAPMAVMTVHAADKPAPHEGVMTQELGKEVPKMTSDEKPAKKSDAPESQTYTGKVGEAVPEMTSPDDGKKTSKN